MVVLLATEEIEHGTYGGYQKCREIGEPCSECKAAAAAYQKQRRRNNPESAARNRERCNLRSRALAELGRRHQGELYEIMEAMK